MNEWQKNQCKNKETIKVKKQRLSVTNKESLEMHHADRKGRHKGSRQSPETQGPDREAMDQPMQLKT